MSAGPGEVSTGSQAGASAATTRSTSMSSGSAITTGPGRPLVATWNAREISSGTRAGIVDLGHPFGDRAEDGTIVEFLKRLALAILARDLADEQDQRGGILLRDVET